jgi:alpha-maltose-1-phosphate synthase
VTIKVAYITLSRRGGMIHYIRQLITHLPESIDSILITRMIPDTVPRTTCYRFGLDPRKILFEYRQIVETIQSFNPDIIHITSGHILLILLMRKFRHKPIIITLHDVTPHVGENTWLHRLIIACQIRSATHIFVHGSLLKKELIKVGIYDDKISVIPHGDYSFFKDYWINGIPEEESILFFGRIVEYKGLNHLLDAMISLQKKNRFKLIIAGEGNLTPYQDKITRIDPKLIEVYNRYIEDDQVARLFQRVKLIILPYTDGTQTGIVPIAYAFSKPVIATNVGSFSEVIENEKTGLLIPPNDNQALQNAIIRLMSDDSLRNQIGKNGYTKMQADLSWNTVISEIVSVYDRTVKAKK